MSYQEKKTLVSILTGILLLAAYCIYTINRIQSNMASLDDLKFWATSILLFIGIGIVASIIIQIVFHILLSIAIAVKKQVQNGKCDDTEIERTIELEMVEDEMVKLIALKSMRINFAVVGVGFLAALVSLVMDYSPAIMLNIVFGAFCIGSLVEGVTQLYFYKRGVRNGKEV